MKVPLTGGFYTAKSVIADAQRCLNLYPEQNPGDSPFPATCYLRPGSTRLSGPVWAPARCTYRTSTGELYEVVGSTVYHTSSSWVRTAIGTISSSTGQISMTDNGLALVIVDGSVNGWAVRLTNDDFAAINGAGAFYGANWCGYLDTFLFFNRPGTNQWYISLSEVDFDMLTGGPILTGSITTGGTLYTNGTYKGVSLVFSSGSGHGATADIVISGGAVTSVTIDGGGVSYRPGSVVSVHAADVGGTGSGFTYTVLTVGSSAFDPLDIAAKTGSPDPIVAILTTRREIWLIGSLTTEVWYNAGAADFTFQALPGAFVEHGCAAQFSPARTDLSIFWLVEDRQGSRMVLKGAQYTAERISTHAIEAQFAKYATIADGVGFIFQKGGHTFYVLTFPSANATWVYDLATGLWHEWGWGADPDNQSCHPAVCSAFVHGVNVWGSGADGSLNSFDFDGWQDNGVDIAFRRGFPHLVEGGKRVAYNHFIADMSVGSTSDQTGPGENLTFVNQPYDTPLTFINGSTPLTFVNGGSPFQYLRWSDTRGYDWGTPIQLQTGSAGDFLQQVQAWRLGMARDRVFELYGVGVEGLAVNGAYIETTSLET